MVSGTPLIWVYIMTYIDNGTAKVPIPEKSGPVSKYQPPKSGTSLVNLHNVCKP